METELKELSGDEMANDKDTARVYLCRVT
jgi:hypothetical protein